MEINHKFSPSHPWDGEPCLPYPGSKMTISGRPEIGLEDVPLTLAAHRFDVLRTSIDPKMVKILTKIFKNHIKEADIYKSIR